MYINKQTMIRKDSDYANHRSRGPMEKLQDHEGSQESPGGCPEWRGFAGPGRRDLWLSRPQWRRENHYAAYPGNAAASRQRTHRGRGIRSATRAEEGAYMHRLC